MNVEVWILLPPASSQPEVAAAADAVVDECKRRGWKYQIRQTSFVYGRPMLEPGELVALYRRVHRARVCIVSIQRRDESGPVFFRRPPPKSKTPSTSRRHVNSVRSFFRHKSLYYRLRSDRDTLTWAGVFAAWLQTVRCGGVRDPRCLPLPVFKSDEFWSKRLLDDPGRSEFEERFGSAVERTDDQGLRWRTGPNHGQDVLQVAGHELPRGFHWDVQGRDLELWTPTEGFRTLDYANVSPDANIRIRPPHAQAIRSR